jgi:hypothetical protein
MAKKAADAENKDRTELKRLAREAVEEAMSDLSDLNDKAEEKITLDLPPPSVPPFATIRHMRWGPLLGSMSLEAGQNNS